MRKKVTHEMEFPASAEYFQEVSLFIEHYLSAKRISREIISETMLVFEALLESIIDQAVDQNKRLLLSCRDNFGEIRIMIKYEGKMFHLIREHADDKSPENRILRAYEDKIDHSYHSGFNITQIVVKRKHLLTVLNCLISILLAIILYLPVHFLGVGLRPRVYFSVICVRPLQTLFGNAALMIGAPVTFFSLLKNLTNSYITSERYSNIRKLQFKSVVTSLFSLLLAIGVSFPLLRRFEGVGTTVEIHQAGEALRAFSMMISEAVPPSIFEPFESISPLPLINVALLLTYALCSSVNYIEKLRKVVNICYTLFGKMLGLIVSALPFFCFLSVLDFLVTEEYHSLILILQTAVFIAVGIFALDVFYLIRLKIAGVNLGQFLLHLPHLILENARINSSIDAAPFNIRYCAHNYGMDRKRLERSIPLLAEINLDGNCFILMCIAMWIVFAAGGNTAWYNIASLALFIFFLSLGAPNQPGSILIGTQILFSFLGITDAVYFAIFMEVFFGILQNIINVIGDIVIAAIDQQSARKSVQ